MTGLGRYRKLLAALAGLLAAAVADGTIEDPAARWVKVFVAAMTALGVWAFPNDPAPVQ